jgi:hypothetical protein
MTGRSKIAKFIKKRTDERPGGYVLLARRFFTCEDLNGPIERDLFAWMIAEARFKDGPKLKRGQLFTSRSKIRARTRTQATKEHPETIWTVKQVRGYLGRLVDAKMIAIESKTGQAGGMIVSILNYDDYQDRGAIERPIKTQDCQGLAGIEGRLNVIEGEIDENRGPIKTQAGRGSTGIEGRLKKKERPIKTQAGRGSTGIEGRLSDPDPDNGSGQPGSKIEIVNDSDTLSPAEKKGLLKRPNDAGSRGLRADSYNNRKNEVIKSISIINDTELDRPGGDSGEVKKSTRVPYDQIIEIWNEVCPDMPQPRGLSDQLKKQIRGRWKESAKNRTLDFWRFYFALIMESEFLTGRTPHGFKATIHWATGPKNFAKVMAGNYYNRRPGGPPMPVTYAQWQDYERRQQSAPGFVDKLAAEVKRRRQLRKERGE